MSERTTTDAVRFEFYLSFEMLRHIQANESRQRHFKSLIGDMIMDILDELEKNAYKKIKRMVLHSYDIVRNRECVICLDPFRLYSQIDVSQCGHGFHTSCMDNIKAHNHRACPVCRESFS